MAFVKLQKNGKIKGLNMKSKREIGARVNDILRASQELDTPQHLSNVEKTPDKTEPKDSLNPIRISATKVCNINGKI